MEGLSRKGHLSKIKGPNVLSLPQNISVTAAECACASATVVCASLWCARVCKRRWNRFLETRLSWLTPIVKLPTASWKWRKLSGNLTSANGSEAGSKGRFLSLFWPCCNSRTCCVPTTQCWAISVFFVIFSLTKNYFLHFYQVNLTGSGLLK